MIGLGTLAGPLAAVLIGLSLGMLGGGGAVLTVPVFVYLLGVPAKSAVAMSMPVVGLTSAVGAWRYWRAGHVQVRLAATFGAVAMAGAFVGARLAAWLTGRQQLLLLGAVMGLTAFSMLRRARIEGAPRDDATESAAAWRLGPLALVVALFVGVLTGLVGIGGGFLVVPALVLLARVPMRAAIGTSLAVITMNATSGLIGYAGRVPIDWGMVAWFAALASAAAVMGAAYADRISPSVLRRAFAGLLFLIAGFLIWQNSHLSSS
jgi:uncharacterized membrane protein YfcA